MWVAWNVTPVPRRGRPAAPGWIVFETTDGREKRRLLASPEGWDELAETELHVMLASAAAARPSKLSFEPGRSGDPRGAGPSMTAHPAASLSDMAPSPAQTAMLSAPPGSEGSVVVAAERVVRSFRYPNGRLWSVCVVRRPEGGGAPLLRFSAGARHLDLHDWPADWAECSPERLVALVRSIPRGYIGVRPGGGVGRRYGDPRE